LRDRAERPLPSERVLVSTLRADTRPLATVDGPDVVGLAKSDQRPTIVGMLAQQSLEQQLVDEITPTSCIEFSADAVGRHRLFRDRCIFGLAK
jgi:hypothetical protein